MCWCAMKAFAASCCALHRIRRGTRGGNRNAAQTAALLSVLANEALKNSLTGLEFAGGIPGSLGGALFMDAGAYGGQMADVVVSSRYYDAETDTIAR